MLDWIKSLGAILISWPIVGLIALLFFRKPILKVIEQFTNSDIRRAKIGPIEIERELNKLAEKVTEQQIEQKRQKAEIDTLRFLISYFVTDAELKHLEKLESGKPFPYKKAGYFDTELRRLRSLSLIKGLTDKGIGGMPNEGDLRTYIRITERGIEYLELRRQVESEAVGEKTE